MALRTVKLGCKTDPGWVRGILESFDEFMADHADCERKAAAMAMGFVAKYADRLEILMPMMDLALEELAHFRQVYSLMAKRGIRLPAKIITDPYVQALLSNCRTDRDGRFLDKLLITGIVEARGAERFRLVAGALKERELKAFYQGLCRAEARHGNLFLKLAGLYFSESQVRKRLSELVACEAEIIKKLPWRASLH